MTHYMSEDMEARREKRINCLRSYSSLGPGQVSVARCHNLAYTCLFQDPFVGPSKAAHDTEKVPPSHE